jgi:L-cystine uptake protein TcyP (sodium:dicarboxylate symporter family)
LLYIMYTDLINVNITHTIYKIIIILFLSFPLWFQCFRHLYMLIHEVYCIIVSGLMFGKIVSFLRDKLSLNMYDSAVHWLRLNLSNGSNYVRMFPSLYLMMKTCRSNFQNVVSEIQYITDVYFQQCYIHRY